MIEWQEPPLALLELELARQHAVCAPEPDCVQRSQSGFGKRLECRCLRLEKMLADREVSP